jgi:4-amino-4-deoxy-L-arabinose transferase-like glycosyltransferase
LLRIFFFALFLRLIYLLELRGQPALYLLMGDSASYDAWAQRIAAGDWLGAEIFYQAPLYPYALGALYALFGHDLFLIRVAQCVLSALACVLLTCAGRDFLDRRSGTAAGVLASLYAPSIYFSCLLQKAVFSHFFMALLLYALGRASQRSRASVWFGAGATLGLFALTRENSLILAPLLLLWPLLGFRAHPLKKRLGWLAASVLGLALILGPTALRNRLVAPASGAGWQLTTAQLGPNLYIGNNPAATGGYAPLLPGRGDPTFEQADAKALAERARGRTLSPAEVSSYWVERVKNFALAEPGQFVKLQWKKWTLFWSATELADTEDFYSYASWSNLLRALSLPFNFGALLALAAAGAVLGWPMRRRLAPLYVVLVTFSLAIVVFYIMDRYRYPIAAPLTLLAGAALSIAHEATRAKRAPRGWPWAAAAASVAALLSLAPATPKSQLQATTRFNIGHGLAARGEHAKAIKWYASSLTLFDQDPQVHNDLAVSLIALGAPDKALQTLETARALAPDSALTMANQGVALAAMGRNGEALKAYEQALAHDPDLRGGRLNLAFVLLDLGRESDAATQFRALLVQEKNDGARLSALNGLARLLAEARDPALRDPTQAVRLAQEALQAAPQDPVLLETLARAYTAAGRNEEAAAVRRRLP